MDPFPSTREKAPRPEKIKPAQYQLAWFIAMAAIASISAWSLSSVGLSATGLLFIAIPATLAAIITLAPFSEDKTSFGVARGSTICILISAIVIREGFICVIIALPLIIPIISLVVWSVRRSRAGAGHQLAWALPLLVLGAAGEGVVYELPTNAVVVESRVIDFSATELDASLDGIAEIPEIEPLLFALPFPEPTAFTGTGADVGDIRTVEFGDGGSDGSLILEVVVRTGDTITWDIIDNTTPVAEWMTINSATATWVETAHGLEVTMEIDFDRALAPAFYFDPVERWGVGEMAEVLLDMLEHNIATNTPDATGAHNA